MYIRLLTLFLVLLAVSSCSKESSTGGLNFKEDPNNYFTATFNGKTLKTTGFILTINGSADNGSSSLSLVNGILFTRNYTTGVSTTGNLVANGSSLNLAYGTTYKIPVQQLDVSIEIERSGDAIGTYKVTESSWPGVIFTSSITDVTVGRKTYDVDPVTTVNITLADAYYIQGTYTGKLIDGTTKIPVTGTFKLRKI